MSFEKLTVENLEDGKAVALLNQMLEMIAYDVIKRPRIKKKRSVTLKVTIVPSKEDDVNAVVEYEVDPNLPGFPGWPSLAATQVNPMGQDELKVFVRRTNQENFLDGAEVDEETGEVVLPLSKKKNHVG